MRLLLVPLILALLGSCGSPRIEWDRSISTAYSEFDGPLFAHLRQALRHLEEGRPAEARIELSGLCAAHPDNLELGTWLQEAELALFEQGGELPEDLVTAAAEHDDPAEALRALYQARVKDDPSVVAFVLAARAETDAIAAGRLLDQALKLDPRCAWALYGRAYALLRDRHAIDRWERAREALDDALSVDSSHIDARRLEAWMLAQEGDSAAAAGALETWLKETAGDPRVSSPERLAAQLDLAIAWVRLGHARETMELCLSLEGDDRERPRRLAILAVAWHELGEPQLALDAARRAEAAQPGVLLPVVQQALVLQHDLENEEAAMERWRFVAEASGDDLASVMQSVHAKVELERAESR